MFQIFKELFSGTESKETESVRPWNERENTREAVASLLIEVAKADYEEDPQELAKIKELLTDYFGMADSEVALVLERAYASVDEAIALHPFTRPIRDELSPEERAQVVEMMWAVAYADGVKDANEEYLIRKVSDLIHVSHPRFIQARQRVEAYMKQQEK